MQDKQEKLTTRQRLFVTEYLRCPHATKAAIAAGYSAKSARQSGSDNLAHPVIQSEINRRLDAHAMSANEIIARLSDMARADMGDFLNVTEKGAAFDFQKAQERGQIHRIKRIALDTNGSVIAVELHDPQTALVTLARMHGLLKRFEGGTATVALTLLRELLNLNSPLAVN